MGLKEVIRAGVLGARVREIVNAHVALSNRVTSGGALLPRLLNLGASDATGPAPTSPALSGGAVPDTPENRAHVDALASAAPGPTDAELTAQSSGLLSPEARASVREAIRREAALRYALERLAAGMPANDV